MFKKKFFLIFMFIPLSIIVLCSIDNKDNELLMNVNDNDVSVMKDSNCNSPQTLCCNNMWPAFGAGKDITMTFAQCEGDEETGIIAWRCARLWAEYNDLKGSDLRYFACGKSIPAGVPGISNISSSIINFYPKIKWGFIYSHYYVLYRKIGNGQWCTIQIDNHLNDGISYGPTEYVDPVVELNKISGYVYYYLKTRIFSDYSSASNTVTLNGLLEPTVNITRSQGHPKVYWSAIQYADGYKVYRKVEGSTNDYILVSTSSSTQFVDNDYTFNKDGSYTLKYTVKSYNSYVASLFSNVVTSYLNIATL